MYAIDEVLGRNLAVKLGICVHTDGKYAIDEVVSFANVGATARNAAHSETPGAGGVALGYEVRVYRKRP